MSPILATNPPSRAGKAGRDHPAFLHKRESHVPVVIDRCIFSSSSCRFGAALFDLTVEAGAGAE
jgi:hypothetical protein